MEDNHLRLNPMLPRKFNREQRAEIRRKEKEILTSRPLIGNKVGYDITRLTNNIAIMNNELRRFDKGKSSYKKRETIEGIIESYEKQLEECKIKKLKMDTHKN